MSGVSSPERFSSERPEYRDEDHSQYPEDQVQRQTHLDEVHEAVAAGAVDHGIGLVAHRCGKTGGGGEGDGDEEGVGSTPISLAVDMPIGVRMTAAAALLMNSVSSSAIR